MTAALHAEEILHPGVVVSHFKRDLTEGEENRYLYKIIGVGIHTETKEELVIYQALYGDHGIYCRPKEMFLSPVDTEKYPDAKQHWRLELYSSPSRR